MNQHLNRLFEILSGDDRRRFYGLLLVMLIMGMLEVAGIGSVVPFIAAVANIDNVLENRYAGRLYDALGLDSRESFVMLLGGAVLTLLIARNLFFAFAHWVISRFTHMWRHELSDRLLRRYLMQPYAYFLSQNTLELKRKVFSETERLVSGLVVPGIRVLTSIIVTTFVISLLIAIDPGIAALVAATLGGSYLVLYLLVYRKLNDLSDQVGEARREQFKVAGEIFEGIKEVKLFGKEQVFAEDYARWSCKSARLDTMSKGIATIPRHGIEMLAVSAIVLFVLYLVDARKDLASWMPLLVVYAISGYRVLPALQQIFSGATLIQYNLPTLEILHTDFVTLPERHGRPLAMDNDTDVFGAIESIELRNVDFRYVDCKDSALRDLNLAIRKNTTVGLVGTTGAGKTTLIDIILGLLRPSAGKLLINGIPVTAINLRGWQRHIGYVPQHVHLLDDTVARNVAFGVPDHEIDRAALESALRVAQLYDFVMESLPEGCDTMLGQRVLRLSGGQRQRIAIARALYHHPDVLVLDEATSALDNATEALVMESLQSLRGQMTVIKVAHRLNTVRDCDVIHYVEDGRVVSSGSYEELAGSCERFQRLVNE